MAFCILAIILLLLPNKLIMKNKIRRIFIGTSGWVYNDWEGIFYPEDLRSKDKLKYFSEHFKTAEINYSFYHLPKPATYQNWYSKTPKDFVFAVKASRYISHIKRLKDVKEAWETFLKNALNLKEKLGPILLQLPPSFKYNSENLSRVKEFLAFATKIKNKRANLRLAIEVRHPSFKNPKFFDLLKKYKAVLVVSDSSDWIKIEKSKLADFVYVRMHGPKTMFSSKYSNEELEDLAQKIKKWQKQRLDIYCYFNNDVSGFAVENAKTLLKFCNK